ncbi:substrate-binding domain-containing protein [Paenibacillus sp. N3.4]|uniref:substrate-binding domain-containing protein n=1 Tax=Paenibacillus sp. N3.4 TaxID=2603222 RepID=UPI0011CB243D|nr:substrate-binding domain-containing protein [Paenibacillus sp. N3.4]TXK85179.1 sugar ABC transporter substrate-binding protein [Paenibacillus sp. N3.4]
MKKLILIAIMISSLLTLAFSFYYMLMIFQSESGMSKASKPISSEHSERIVIISQEQGSFMMNEIQRGARDTAETNQMMIDFWGVYRSNVEELIKQIDIAIASKVNGIIVEGLDHPEFDRMVKKATAKGIPVITINSDAPGSLRKSYVGSDHYQEGIIMGEHIAAQLNGKGLVGVIRNMTTPTMDDLRLKGLSEAFSKYDGIKMVFASDDMETTQPNMQTYDILNHYPNVSAFIGLPTESGESIFQASHARSRTKEYQIFIFDDSPQTIMLIRNGLIRAGLSQHYKEMGSLSVNLMKRWLNAKQLPLNNSYFTTISVVTSAGEKEKDLENHSQ